MLLLSDLSYQSAALTRSINCCGAKYGTYSRYIFVNEMVNESRIFLQTDNLVADASFSQDEDEDEEEVNGN